MKTKNVYTVPEITSEEIKIGVFGCYGGNHNPPGNHPKPPWWPWWWPFG